MIYMQTGNQRTEELNQRISQRNLPSAPLQPQFGLRAVSTKYAMLPVLDQRVFPSVDIQPLPAYDIGTNFNPGTAQAPWAGFANRVNDESRLRNQFFALQRGAGQACYIPAHNSDMYEVNVPKASQPVEQTCPLLFHKPQFEQFNPCPSNSGIHAFNNFTRHQLREMA